VKDEYKSVVFANKTLGDTCNPRGIGWILGIYTKELRHVIYIYMYIFGRKTVSQSCRFAEESGAWYFYETGGSPDVVYRCDGKR
jgi:hypothetical protein